MKRLFLQLTLPQNSNPYKELHRSLWSTLNVHRYAGMVGYGLVSEILYRQTSSSAIESRLMHWVVSIWKEVGEWLMQEGSLTRPTVIWNGVRGEILSRTCSYGRSGCCSWRLLIVIANLASLLLCCACTRHITLSRGQRAAVFFWFCLCVYVLCLSSFDTVSSASDRASGL